MTHVVMGNKLNPNLRDLATDTYWGVIHNKAASLKGIVHAMGGSSVAVSSPNNFVCSGHSFSNFFGELIAWNPVKCPLPTSLWIGT